MNTYEIIDKSEVMDRLGIDNVPEKVHVIDMSHGSVHVKYSGEEYTHCWSYDTFNELIGEGAITME